MRKWMMLPVLVLGLVGCAREATTMRQAVEDSVQVELADHGPNPEPSVWGTYTMAVPEVDAAGNPLSYEVAMNFYVNGRFLEEHSTSAKRGAVESNPRSRERDRELKSVSGRGRLPLHAVAAPGESGEVTLEIVYSVKNEKTGKLLFAGTNSAARTIQPPETQP